MGSYVRLLCGALGSGKTSLAVREMVQGHRADPGRLFATNIDVTDDFMDVMEGRCIRLGFDSIQAFWEHTPAGCCAYLDEITVHFDSRDAMRKGTVSNSLTKYLMHVRKFRDEVTIIAHDFGHVDKRIRDFCTLYTWLVSTRRLLQGLGFRSAVWLPEFFILRDYLSDDYTGHLGTRWVRSDPAYWRYFDSYALGTAEGLKRLGVADSADSGCLESCSARRGRVLWPLGLAAAAGVVGALL